MYHAYWKNRKSQWIAKCPARDIFKRKNKEMTFYLKLNRRAQIKTQTYAPGRLLRIQKEVENALSMVNEAENETNDTFIIALDRIFEFHCKAYEGDTNYGWYSRLCKEKGIKTRGRDYNDYAATLKLLVGKDRSLSSKRSRWKGVFEEVNRIGVTSTDFKDKLSKESIKVLSDRWYRYKMPEQKQRALERDQLFVDKHRVVVSRLDGREIEDLRENIDALVVQKSGGELSFTKIPYQGASELRRLFSKRSAATSTRQTKSEVVALPRKFAR